MNGTRGVLQAPLQALLLALLLAGTGPAQEVPPAPPSPVPALLALLDSDEAALRQAAADRLGALRGAWFDGPPAAAAIAPLLLRFEGEADEAAASAMAFALVELGPAPLHALDFLAARLVDWRGHGAPPDALDGIARALAARERSWPGRAVVPFLAAIVEASPCRHGALGALLLLGPEGAGAAPAVVPLLQHADHSVRWRAAAALAAIGGAPQGECGELLDDADPRVRFWSAQVLLRGAEEPPPADAVVPWLADPRPPVRHRAFGAAARVGNLPPVVPQTLARALQDEVDTAAAADALCRLGPRAAAAVPPLLRVLEGGPPGAVSPAARAGAVRALGAIGPAAGEAVVALLGLVAAADLYSELPREAGAALSCIAPSRAVTGLMRIWERDAAAGRDEWWSSARALAAMGAAALPELPRFVAAVERGPRAARANALAVLGAFGPAARPALPAVLHSFAARDQWTSWLAKDALLAMQVDGSDVVPVLQEAYAADPVSRGSLLQGLHRLGAAAEPLLLAGLRDPDPVVAMVAEPELARLPAPSPAAVAAMLARLRSHAGVPFRVAAGRRLARCLAEQPEVAAALVAELPPLLEHEDFHVFAPVARILLRELCPAAGAHPRFERLLAAAPDRAAVRRALAGETALAAFVRGFARHGDPGVRAAAAVLLPLLEADVAANTAALTALAADPEPAVRGVAAAGLQAGSPGSDCLPRRNAVFRR